MNSTEIYNTTSHVDEKTFAVSADGTKSALVEVTNQEDEDFAVAITVVITNHQNNAQQRLTLDAEVLESVGPILGPMDCAVSPLVAYFHEPTGGPQEIVVGTSMYLHIWTLDASNTYRNILVYSNDFASAFAYDPGHSQILVANGSTGIVSRVTIANGQKEHLPLLDGTFGAEEHGLVTGIVIRADTSIMVQSHGTDISWYKLGADGTRYVCQKHWNGHFTEMTYSPNCDATFAVRSFSNMANTVCHSAVKIFPRRGEMDLFQSVRVLQEGNFPRIIGITKKEVYWFVNAGDNSAIQKIKHGVSGSPPIRFINGMMARPPRTYCVIGGKVVMVGNSNQLIIAYGDGDGIGVGNTFVHRCVLP